ncbi:MAG: hypothetical protein J6D30_01570 [Clostridia bacterium]|nr:hypothetical protein [Clostridia bacterium]
MEEMEEQEILVEGNEPLQRFIQLICDLNHQTVEILKTGNIELLYAMNDTIEEMYNIQNGNPAPEYAEIDEQSQMIYKNFNAIITMINSNEKDELDEATSNAVKMFLRNIFEANVGIVKAYGLA